MKYNITYKSRDINRPDVLIYGKEELVLFEINVEVNKNVDFTRERFEFLNKIIDENYINTLSEEERTSISEEANRLSPNDFTVYYSVFLYTKTNLKNLCQYQNEHKEIYDEHFKTFKKDIHALEILDNYLIEHCAETGPLEYEGMLEYHTVLKNLVEEKLDNICERYEWEYQKINWDISEPGNAIEEHINMLINMQTTTIENEDVEGNIVEEIPESEENNSEEMIENETTEEPIENEQPIE